MTARLIQVPTTAAENPRPWLLLDNGDAVPAVGIVNSDGSLVDPSGQASASTLTVAHASLSTSAAQVLAANTSRVFAEVKNLDSGISIYLGKDNTVTSSNGHLLGPGEAFAFDGYTGAVWAIAASGTPSVSTIEW